MKVLKNELLKQHTSFRVGGPAKVYVVPESIEELEKLIHFLYEEKLPYDIIGNGTNLLVSDAGVDHVVVEIGRALEEITLLPSSHASGGILPSRVWPGGHKEGRLCIVGGIRRKRCEASCECGHAPQ